MQFSRCAGGIARMRAEQARRLGGRPAPVPEHRSLKTEQHG
jgi:hypothetical protein